MRKVTHLELTAQESEEIRNALDVIGNLANFLCNDPDFSETDAAVALDEAWDHLVDSRDNFFEDLAWEED